MKSVLTPSPANTSAGITVLVVTTAAELAARSAQYFAEYPIPSTVAAVFCAQSEANEACDCADAKAVCASVALLLAVVAEVAAELALVAASLTLLTS